MKRNGDGSGSAGAGYSGGGGGGGGYLVIHTSKRDILAGLGGSKRRGRIASNLHQADRLKTVRELLAVSGSTFSLGGMFRFHPVTFMPWNNGKPREGDPPPLRRGVRKVDYR